MFVQSSSSGAADRMRAKATRCRHLAHDKPASDGSYALIALAEEYELEAILLDQEQDAQPCLAEQVA
jgi:hypothetical protein